MAFLKRNRLIPFIFFFVTSGCATSSFKLLKQDQNAAELNITPDRVLVECEYQYDNDDKDAYGFLMRILDDENTVVTIAQMNILDKESCFKRIRKITEILKTGKMIYVGGMGDLTEPRTMGEKQYNFPQIGTFRDNGHTLQFMVIANEQGFCYDAYSGDKKPCPQEPFSIKNLK
jgi:hypothetical protein